MTTERAYSLTQGDCLAGMSAMESQSVDHIITDPPYSERTHAANDGTLTRNDNSRPTELNYGHLTPKQVSEVAQQMVRVCRGWILVMTDHVLWPSWEAALGRYTFPPLPVVIKGMTVRLLGDGPSSWCVWLVVNRPIGFPLDGTKDGAYVGDPGSRADNPIKGSKPRWLMDRLICDYTQPGQVILDPYMGGGTTGESALRYGRRFIGFDSKPEHFAIAERRIAAAKEQLRMFPERKAKPKQETML